MAKVTQPLGSIEARGSVGGLTYNTWRGIRTVKTRSGPAAVPSALMLERLAIAAMVTVDWKGLDQNTRDAWNAWAANQREPSWTGQDKRLTGYNWFVRIYVRTTLLDIYGIPEIPHYVITHHLEDLTLISTPPALYLSWHRDVFPDNADYWVEVYLAGPLSAGKNATIHNAFRQGANEYTNSPYTLPPPTPGTYTAFARLMHITGLVTPWQSARITIPP